jgi:hypothetical protein
MEIQYLTRAFPEILISLNGHWKDCAHTKGYVRTAESHREDIALRSEWIASLHPSGNQDVPTDDRSQVTGIVSASTTAFTDIDSVDLADLKFPLPPGTKKEWQQKHLPSQRVVEGEEERYQTMGKLEEEMYKVLKEPTGHTDMYQVQFRDFVVDVGETVEQKYGEESSEKSDVYRGRGKYSNEALDEKFTPIYIQEGRVIKRKIAVVEVARDVDVQHAKAIGAPNYSEQTSAFASNSGIEPGSVVPGYPPAVIDRFQKRVRDWGEASDIEREFPKEEGAVHLVSDDDEMWDCLSATDDPRG